MTGRELLTAACHLFFDTNTAYYEPFALTHINMLLSDTYEANNGIRLNNGKTILTEIPSIVALSDHIPYEDSLVRGAFPYGLASKLYFDDNDTGRQMLFQQHFVNAVNESERGFVKITRGI